MLLILGGRAMVDLGGVETRKKEFYSTILSESRGPALPDKLLMISDSCTGREVYFLGVSTQQSRT